MQRLFAKQFHIDTKSLRFVYFGTIKKLEEIFLVVMNDFRLVDCVNNDKPTAGLVLVATEPRLDEFHYSRTKTLFGKLNICSHI